MAKIGKSSRVRQNLKKRNEENRDFCDILSKSLEKPGTSEKYFLVLSFLKPLGILLHLYENG